MTCRTTNLKNFKKIQTFLLAYNIIYHDPKTSFLFNYGSFYTPQIIFWLTCQYFDVPYQASYSWLMTVAVVCLFHIINCSHQQWVPGVRQFVHPLVAIQGPIPVSSYMDCFPDPASFLIVTLAGQYRGFVPVYHMVALGGVISKGWLFLFILCLRFSGAGELLARHSLDWVLVFLESAPQVPSCFTNVGGITVGTRDFVYKVTCVKPGPGVFWAN